MRATAEAPRAIPTTWEEPKLEEGVALSATEVASIDPFEDDALDGDLDVLEPGVKYVAVSSPALGESCENRVVGAGGFWVESEGTPLAITTLVICCVASG